MAGINRALLKNKSLNSTIFESASSSSRRKKPCVFLSHISIDKDTVKSIGDYITESGNIDIYLDIYDSNLQQAVNRGDARRITKAIEDGVSQSTHAMCLISNLTVNSWWVPYEIGFAKKSRKEISSLKLKGNTEIPDFLKIEKVIMGTKSLNEYIEEIKNKHNRMEPNSMIYDSLKSHTGNHPLDSYLDWKL